MDSIKGFDIKVQTELDKLLMKSMLDSISNNELIEKDIYNKVIRDIDQINTAI